MASGKCFGQPHLQSVKVQDQIVTIAVLVRLIYRPKSGFPTDVCQSQQGGVAFP
jgi:hypothetical protein